MLIVAQRNNIISEVLSPAEDAELVERYRADPRAFVEKFLYIIPEKEHEQAGQLIRLRYNWAQMEVYNTVQKMRAEGRPVRILILKARRTGQSTFAASLLFMRARLWRHQSCMLLNYEADSAESLFLTLRRYYENLPKLLRPLKVRYNKKLMHFANPDEEERDYLPGLDSRIQAITAKNLQAGRSLRVDGLHVTEAALFKDGATVMGSVLPAVPPDGWAMVETTSNGAGGWFYDTWMEAVAKKNEWVPIFLPWHSHPAYTTGCSEAELGPLFPDEKEMIRAHQLSHGQLDWRRKTISTTCNNSIVKWYRDFPSTFLEAFTVAGESIFDPLAINHFTRAVAERDEKDPPETGYLTRDEFGRVRFVKSANGALTVWDRPHVGWAYGMGTDCSVGKDAPSNQHYAMKNGDWSVACVLDQQKRQACEMRSQSYDPADFADQVYMLGEYYNYALANFEAAKTGGGYMMLNRLMKLRYHRLAKAQKYDEPGGRTEDKFGFIPSASSKAVLVGTLQREVRHGAGLIPSTTMRLGPKLVINSKVVVSELTTFTTEGAKPGTHDDSAWAIGLALLALEQMPVPVPLSPHEEQLHGTWMQAKDGSMGIRPFTGWWNAQGEEPPDGAIEDWPEWMDL